MQKHVLSVLVENRAGVLNKVTGLFSRRGFNIDSLSVGTTENKDISRITIVTYGDEYIIEQITKQLYKIIEVIKVRVVSQDSFIGRETCFVKIKADEKTRSQIIGLSNIFRASIVDVSKETLTVELTGPTDKIDAFEEMAKQYGILEMVRSGLMAIERGTKILS